MRLTLTPLAFCLAGFLAQTPVPLGTIEGRVVSDGRSIIRVTRDSTGESTDVRISELGRYRVELPPGRYRVALVPTPKFPVPIEHSAFSLASGETVVVNLRAIPIERSLKVTDLGLHSTYTDNMPQQVVHFVASPGRSYLSNLRCLFYRTTVNGEVQRYRFADCSFEQLSLRAGEVEYDTAKQVLTAQANEDWGDVLFEDGKRSYSCGRLTLDLATGTAEIAESKDSSGVSLERVRGGGLAVGGKEWLFVDTQSNKTGTVEYNNDLRGIKFASTSLDSIVRTATRSREEIVIRGVGRFAQIDEPQPFALKLQFEATTESVTIRYSMDLHLLLGPFEGSLQKGAITVVNK